MSKTKVGQHLDRIEQYLAFMRGKGHEPESVPLAPKAYDEIRKYEKKRVENESIATRHALPADHVPFRDTRLVKADT